MCVFAEFVVSSEIMVSRGIMRVPPDEQEREALWPNMPGSSVGATLIDRTFSWLRIARRVRASLLLHAHNLPRLLESRQQVVVICQHNSEQERRLLSACLAWAKPNLCPWLTNRWSQHRTVRSADVGLFSAPFWSTVGTHIQPSFSCACKIFEMKSFYIWSIKYKLITKLITKLNYKLWDKSNKPN